MNALLAREVERGRALVEQDFDRLADLFDDDLVYAHTSGVTQNRTEYLAYAREVFEFLEVRRGTLKIRSLADDVAVMSGPMTYVLRRRGESETQVLEAVAMQVWTRRDETWRMVAFQATRKP
ncbi:hypothetical protein B1810_19525 [Panacagrimonas perspica]|nr:hypothetical protein B1810_19525 [Panacagrimonas perspica]